MFQSGTAFAGEGWFLKVAWLSYEEASFLTLSYLPGLTLIHGDGVLGNVEQLVIMVWSSLE